MAGPGGKMEPTVALTANRGLVSRRPTLTDDTYDAIMGLLMSQQIKPGQRINIDALSRVLGVSVTPVRESLARLESEALVTKRPLVGYAATPLLSLDQLDDMYDVRLALEPLAARQAALRADGEQLEELAAAVGPRRDTIEPRSDEHLLVALDDARLHSAIASATGNDFLRDAVQRLHSHLHLYRLYQSAQIAQKATLREHDLIIRALRRRDSEAAEQAMRKHLEASRARLVEIVERARGLPR